MRARIQKNIAAALLALGKHHQGAETLGLVLEGTGDAGAAFNLLLCANALGDGARVKGLFDTLLKVGDVCCDGWVHMFCDGKCTSALCCVMIRLHVHLEVSASYYMLHILSPPILLLYSSYTPRILLLHRLQHQMWQTTGMTQQMGISHLMNCMLPCCAVVPKCAGWWLLCR